MLMMIKLAVLLQKNLPDYKADRVDQNNDIHYQGEGRMRRNILEQMSANKKQSCQNFVEQVCHIILQAGWPPCAGLHSGFQKPTNLVHTHRLAILHAWQATEGGPAVDSASGKLTLPGSTMYNGKTL